MTKAHVVEHWERDEVGIAVRLGSNGHEVQYLRWVAPAVATIAEGSQAGPDDDAELRLPIDTARAIHEALSRFFGGAPESVSLRKDLDAERARVDKLIDYATRSVVTS